MKQKVVIRVQMVDEKKRSKAMRVAVGLSGVASAAIEGADKDLIVVIGDGVDCITLTTLLRKKLGFAEIVSVSAVEEEKKEQKKEEKKEEKPVVEVWSPCGGGYPVRYYHVTEVGHHSQEPRCFIL